MPRSLVVDASFAFQLILPGPRQASFQAQAKQWKQGD